MKSIQILPKDDRQFKMTLKKYALTITCHNKWICQKWVNSINYVFANLIEYVAPELIDVHFHKDDRYLTQVVYQKVTGKIAFKDYELICE